MNIKLKMIKKVLLIILNYKIKIENCVIFSLNWIKFFRCKYSN